MWEAVNRGPHQSSLSPKAIAHFKAKSKEKVAAGQARLVLWDGIKDDTPPELKVSPIAAIPHKSKEFRLILDLSFWLQLKNGGFLKSVNDTTVKSAPTGALDQLGPALSHIIHAFVERQTTMQRFSWQNGISRTVSGAWLARPGRSGTSHTFFHRNKTNQQC
jgi:hypothetical protein